MIAALALLDIESGDLAGHRRQDSGLVERRLGVVQRGLGLIHVVQRGLIQCGVDVHRRPELLDLLVRDELALVFLIASERV